MDNLGMVGLEGIGHSVHNSWNAVGQLLPLEVRLMSVRSA